MRRKILRLWEYKWDDRSTWKYLTYRTIYTCNNGTKLHWVLNPKFKYKEVDKDYNK